MDFIKCNCNHCSNHLEFDPANAGEVITCPSCGLETTLYVPTAPPVPKVEKPAPFPATPATPPPQKTNVPGMAAREKFNLKSLRWIIIAVVVIALLSLLFHDPHPSRLSGVYVLGNSGFPIDVDLRSDGTSIFYGSDSTWTLHGDTVYVLFQSGKSKTFKVEGQDLTDADGNRWMRQR